MFSWPMLALLALLLLAVYTATQYNAVQRLAQRTAELAANIEVLQKKRTDLIDRLAAIAESYGGHERGLNEAVAKAFGQRAAAAPPGTMVERLASLRMQFPELRADGLYESLMNQLSGVEHDIALRREQYNRGVRAFNTILSQFPQNLLLRVFAFEPKAFWADGSPS